MASASMHLLMKCRLMSAPFLSSESIPYPTSKWLTTTSLCPVLCWAPSNFQTWATAHSKRNFCYSDKCFSSISVTLHMRHLTFYHRLWSLCQHNLSKILHIGHWAHQSTVISSSQVFHPLALPEDLLHVVISDTFSLQFICLHLHCSSWDMTKSVLFQMEAKA